MRVELLIPDVTPGSLKTPVQKPDVFSNILNDLGSVLGNAQQAEDAFASGAGDLQTAIYERAQADVALSVATAAAQRSAQALQSVLNMQV